MENPVPNPNPMKRNNRTIVVIFLAELMRVCVEFVPWFVVSHSLDNGTPHSAKFPTNDELSNVEK
jgi:hypothetical protein